MYLQVGCYYMGTPFTLKEQAGQWFMILWILLEPLLGTKQAAVGSEHVLYSCRQINRKTFPPGTSPQLCKASCCCPSVSAFLN